MVVVIKKSDSNRSVQRKLKSIKPQKAKKLLDAYKYKGILKINENPNEIQKKLRDEWQ